VRNTAGTQETGDAGCRPAEIEVHRREAEESRRLWRRKPLLDTIYGDFYRQIAACLNRSIPGIILEIGSGMGTAKAVIPECVTSDLFPYPWLDRQEDAYRLSPPDSSAANLILFDVWHHLRFPGAALKEFRRVLAPGGRVVIFDPAMGLLGRIIYGLCHHEPLGYAEPIDWSVPENFDPATQTYYAAQANCWRMFRPKLPHEALPGWRVASVKLLPALAYVASGGIRGPQLYPAVLLPMLRFLEKLSAPFPGLFATRMLVVLEKI
jgi:SAM-dependent methyltransferase